MGKRRIEELIPIAIEEINKLKIKEESEKENKFFEVKEIEGEKVYKIYKEYNGYISSFGASIVQSGLIACVAFFENDNSNSNRDRKKIPKLIFNTIVKYKEIKNDQHVSLLKYVLEEDKNHRLNSVKQEIIDSATAVKLSMRVFQFTDEKVR